MRVLHLEDNPNDALLVRRTLHRHRIDADIHHAQDIDEFYNALGGNRFDVVILDNGVPGLSGLMALKVVRERTPKTPVIICSGVAQEADVEASFAAGATDYVLKDHPWQLVATMRRLQKQDQILPSTLHPPAHSVERLVQVVQELSLTRTLDSVIAVVRRAARELTGADGATFILRDRDQCYYVDENAIAPLWKGRRFPMSACVSGWSMLNSRSTVIRDIYTDPRIPIDAYRPTFVKSLAMVPIRTEAPIGAIGNYWAVEHMATAEELMLLETLANTTSVAMENVQVYAELDRRVKARTRELESANRELESFSYAVSHDLRAPLRMVRSELDELLESGKEGLEDHVRARIENARAQAIRMTALIEDLLRLAKIAREELQRERVDLSGLAAACIAVLRTRNPARQLDVTIEPDVHASADPGLIAVALENLLSNAWKYTARTPRAHIVFGMKRRSDGTRIFFVRDNGVGFDMHCAARLFSPFHRLHRFEDFPGTGIGLATVMRIIDRHGGRIWADAAPGEGACFFFTIPC